MIVLVESTQKPMITYLLDSMLPSNTTVVRKITRGGRKVGNPAHLLTRSGGLKPKGAFRPELSYAIMCSDERSAYCLANRTKKDNRTERSKAALECL